ncbi:hypothetical protein ONS95_004617 [Cadophora gregata]|uniref:uncharacterized protein n=1 Tax=Cadophora gregata TaxID=51156 RepID=UPI0026DD40A5|nr:uncharacterized protein ONS95_004617 [Cadophora gregata]KAK0105014.1 hypothetical protein ONS96_004420 [Cadophora gregata f. sp. sojae]KAK0106113.1 hypothetical protein ONS95_004617 [Cadophora gregata]
MRLLNVHSMKLEEYFGSQIPPYAILSHTWGAEEVTFQDINGNSWQEKAGAQKITLSSQQAGREKLDYVWIDTCCIDKTSSAELSEAINSMFTWYENAVICFAYLSDISLADSAINSPELDLEETLRKSKWFTRGWTLQELIAPRIVHFYDQNWKALGDKNQLSATISSITTIGKDVLANSTCRDSASIARKMSWAAGRETTRVEDIAYSLFGIFNVNMPLLYGEGKRAFMRLQEEILKETDDHSLFAWDLVPLPDHKTFDTNEDKFISVLAESPNNFKTAANIVPFPNSPDDTPCTMTSRGLRFDMHRLILKIREGLPGVDLAGLRCHWAGDFSCACAIVVESVGYNKVYRRTARTGIMTIDSTFTEEYKAIMKSDPIYLAKSPVLSHKTKSYKFEFQPPLAQTGFEIVGTAPVEGIWHIESDSLQVILEQQIAVNGIAVAFYNFDAEVGFSVRHFPRMPKTAATDPVGHTDLIRLCFLVWKPSGMNKEEWMTKCSDLSSLPSLVFSLSSDVSQESRQHLFDITAPISSTWILNQHVTEIKVKILRKPSHLSFMRKWLGGVSLAG